MDGAHDMTVPYWQKQLQRHMTTHGQVIKVAATPMDGGDIPFEQAFSNLAHAYIKDKAPTLLDHELGFQLLDRNEENTKAVGVLVFKVGSLMLYSPVFFIQGDLKGHELLYIKNQDMFVPLKENWLHYIINRKPNRIGSGVSQQTEQLGVAQPDLQRLSEPPSKYASAVMPAAQDFIPLYSHLITADWGEAVTDYATHCQDRLDLSHFVKQASLPMLKVLVDTFHRKPQLAQIFDEFHGLGTLHDAIKEAHVRLDAAAPQDDPYAVTKYRPITGSVLASREKDAIADVRGRVLIVTMESSTQPLTLTDEDREQLVKDEVLITDDRSDDEVSVAVKSRVGERLANPGETGVYQVLTKPGEFEKCLVVVGPHGKCGRENHCVVVRLNNGYAWGNYPKQAVWVADQLEDTTEFPGDPSSWEKWFDKLSDSDITSNSRSTYMAVGPNREASCAFRVYKSYGSYDGGKSYEISFDTYLSNGGGDYPRALNSGYSDGDYSSPRLHIDAKNGTKLRSNAGDVYLPKTYKIIKLSNGDYDDDMCCNPCGASGSKTEPLRLGNMVDAQMLVMSKTAELRIKESAGQYWVNQEFIPSHTAALSHLVRDHGLREEPSRTLLKLAQARSRSGNAVVCRVKYASPYLTDTGGPNAPHMDEPPSYQNNMLGYDGPTSSPYEQEQVVPELQASNTDPSVYDMDPQKQDEPMDVAAVQQAAATGQKEVFDTSVISSMLKAVRDDTMIDRYLPDLTSGMDKLGRLMFMFYWHQDKFAERYGKQDLPELEDSLRNAFEVISDVILFLKQKTVEPYLEEDTQDTDLGDASAI